MEDRTEKETLPGIRCNVANCVYNDQNSGCTAAEIKVGRNFAVTSADTLCQTFEQEKQAACP